MKPRRSYQSKAKAIARRPWPLAIFGLALIYLMGLIWPKPAKPIAPAANPKRWLSFSVITSILLVCLASLVYSSYRNNQPPQDYKPAITPSSLASAYSRLTVQVNKLENAQSKSEIQVVSDAQLRGQLATIQLETQGGHFSGAKRDIAALSGQVAKWQTDLAAKLTAAVQVSPVIAKSTGPAPPNSINLPILLYHYPPANFERQLQVLVERGYTTVSLDQVAAALAHAGTLPAKPVVITFDDGFANQMTAFALLQKYQMKATYYIITGGSASHYCIGAGRRFDQPQPCGDAYLTWDQIRTLDASGLITIGGHTVDHLSLALQTPEVQKFEIENSKTEIEQQIGHPIYHFAYPYGTYNATTIALVQAAGYTTAVTTLPGTYQTIGSPYTLHRIRDTLSLP